MRPIDEAREAFMIVARECERLFAAGLDVPSSLLARFRALAISTIKAELAIADELVVRVCPCGECPDSEGELEDPAYCPTEGRKVWSVPIYPLQPW